MSFTLFDRIGCWVQSVVVGRVPVGQDLSLRIVQPRNIQLILAHEGCLLLLAHSQLIELDWGRLASSDSLHLVQHLDLREVRNCTGFEAAVDLASLPALLLKLELVVELAGLGLTAAFVHLKTLHGGILPLIVLKLAKALAEILRQEGEGKRVRIGHLLRFLEVFSPLRCGEIACFLALKLLEVLAHRCQGKWRPELGEHFFCGMHVDHLVTLVSSVDEQLGSDEAVELFLGEQRRTIDDDSVG